jgi:chemotaxis signal transduction protein
MDQETDLPCGENCRRGMRQICSCVCHNHGVTLAIVGWSPSLESDVASSGLECLVGHARMAVPADSVGQIVEYEVSSPLPLARRFIGGVALIGDHAVVSVSLAAPDGRHGHRRHRTKGVLLRARSGELPWAVEVTEVGGFVRVAFPPVEEARRPDRLPAWVRLGRTADGKVLGWIDVQSMIEELGEDGTR